MGLEDRPDLGQRSCGPSRTVGRPGDLKALERTNTLGCSGPGAGGTFAQPEPLLAMEQPGSRKRWAALGVDRPWGRGLRVTLGIPGGTVGAAAHFEKPSGDHCWSLGGGCDSIVLPIWDRSPKPQALAKGACTPGRVLSLPGCYKGALRALSHLPFPRTPGEGPGGDASHRMDGHLGGTAFP